jgi:hypothetical protein
MDRRPFRHFPTQDHKDLVVNRSQKPGNHPFRLAAKASPTITKLCTNEFSRYMDADKTRSGNNSLLLFDRLGDRQGFEYELYIIPNTLAE